MQENTEHTKTVLSFEQVIQFMQSDIGCIVRDLMRSEGLSLRPSVTVVRSQAWTYVHECYDKDLGAANPDFMTIAFRHWCEGVAGAVVVPHTGEEFYYSYVNGSWVSL